MAASYWNSADDMADSDSPLSELSSSDDLQDPDIKPEESIEAAHPIERAPKRQRTGTHTFSEVTLATSEPPAYVNPDGAISEDTEGSVPASPNHTGYGGATQDEDTLGESQVTVCKWDGCPAGDLGNMDNLVEHIHEEHIGTRQKKYSCEWTDCNRKGIPHASGYALRAHMRSHTREKPFYCSLPECDRSFTRSDALAKHMRTVHETEALRPSDPVPKHHSSNLLNQLNQAHRTQRLRLVVNKPPPTGSAASNGSPGSPFPASPSSHTAPAGATALAAAHPLGTTQHIADPTHALNNISYLTSETGEPVVAFPADIHFTDHELSLHPEQLYRLLKRQLAWAKEEEAQLKNEISVLEEKRRKEWAAKELVVENLMEAEFATMEGKGQVATLESEAAGLRGVREAMREDIDNSKALEIKEMGGKKPWWRAPRVRDAEMADDEGAARESKMESVETGAF